MPPSHTKLKFLFSSNIDHEFETLRNSFQIALDYTIKRMHRLIDLPQSFPSKDNRRFKRAIGDLDNVVNRLVAERRAKNNSEWNDLLDMLCACGKNQQ